MKSTTILYVSPVERVPSQGRDRQVYSFIDPATNQLVQTKAMRKTRETGTEAVYAFQPSYSQNKYLTGLDERIKNPFQDASIDDLMNKYNLPVEWRKELEKIITFSEITKQSYYEILHGQVPGFYTSALNPLNSIFKASGKKREEIKETTFIDRFTITLYDGSNRFTDETPRGALAIQLIKNHPRIAPDKKSVNPVVHHYYISEENEAEMEKMRKQDLIDDANAMKYDLLRKHPDYKAYQVASLCTSVDGKPIVKGTTTRDGVKIAFNNYLGEGRDQMRNIDKFMEVTDLLRSIETKAYFECKYLVAQGLANGVLGIRDGSLFWYSKSLDSTKYKWTSEDKFISFLVTEYNTYNPDESMQNYYQDLVAEVKSKGAWIE